jgi:rubrerythrin
LHTRKLLLALAAEEAGHAEALSAMAERISKS